MKYAISIVAAAPVRKEPSHKTEMVNQLLFGETMEVLEKKDEWYKIKSIYDEYEGWLTHHLITEVDEKMAMQASSYVATQIIDPVVTSDESMFATLGSPLTGFNPATKELWDKKYKYMGLLRNIEEPVTQKIFKDTIGFLCHAPYLWGGKTFMGIDCSGFAQTVFRVLGIKIKRDAWQQAEQGILIENLSEAKEKDLAFFHNEKGSVTHVGIILDGNKIIHSSGTVRIDPLDEQGIIHYENKSRTHRLHSIKRFTDL